MPKELIKVRDKIRNLKNKDSQLNIFENNDSDKFLNETYSNEYIKDLQEYKKHLRKALDSLDKAINAKNKLNKW